MSRAEFPFFLRSEVPLFPSSPFPPYIHSFVLDYLAPAIKYFCVFAKYVIFLAMFVLFMLYFALYMLLC